MKYVRLRVQFSEATIHPVHAALCRSDAVDRDVLLHGNTATPGRDTFLFYVEGDPEAYDEMLQAAPMVTDWELTDLGSQSFYAFIRQTTPDIDAELFATFSRTGVITVPPIEFHDDGTAAFTVIGEPGALQQTIDDLPDAMDAQVDRIGEYTRRQEAFDPGLTERQFEAVQAGVEVGYYASPREGSVEDVGASLGVAPATAAEHLRKAERRVMEELVGVTDPL